MISTLTVRYKIPDARAEAKRRELGARGFARKVRKVEIADIYTIDARLAPRELRSILPLFTEPSTQTGKVNPHIRTSVNAFGARRKQRSFGVGAGGDLAPTRFSFAVEIGFLPGVTDNVGKTAQQTVEDFLKKKFKPGEGVYTSRLFYITGSLRREDAERIARELHNPLIERARIKDFATYRKERGMGSAAPKVALGKAPAAREVDLFVPDEELAAIGGEGIRMEHSKHTPSRSPSEEGKGRRQGPLALDLDALKTIRDYFHRLGRNPTDVELESIAQTWSEHCKHTIFADPLDEVREGIFRRFIRGATERIMRTKKDFCVSVFTDNSGAIAFDDEYLITHKVETHNSPSALDPFGGALTGIVGVNRDTLGFGLGAKPVANTYGFCLADPDDARALFRDAGRTQPLFSARRIMEGVIAGVNTGGNCSGIPTPQGFFAFDPSFRGKPLVFAGTVGLIPRKIGGRISHEKRARPGDYIVMIGGRVGIDGIHGATFSSVALHAGSPATAVQIGDPITQKKLSDVLVREARGRGLYHSITDDGAGGLSCSVAEMARESGGCLVNLDKVPLKYPGLAPWQIWISESQERMTLAVPPSKWKEFEGLMKSRAVEATRIGTFTASGKCVVTYGRRTVMDVELSFLHDGRPVRLQKSAGEKPPAGKVSLSAREGTPADFTGELSRMLLRPNIGSFASVSQQYDHEVQGSSVTKPLQGRGRVNADATVLRPVLTSRRGIVLSQGIYPWYAERDPYRMAACAIDAAVRNAVAAGADPDRIAILDNFCWSDSKNPERLRQLKETARACYDYAVAYGTPFISGKDSMWNDFKGFDAQGKPAMISALPTLLISGLGIIEDVSRAVTLDAKSEGDIVYLLGRTYDELGGSEYEGMQNEKADPPSPAGFGAASAVPEVRAGYMRLYHAFHEAAKRGAVSSAISVGRGGLGVALAKMAIAGELGVDAALEGTSDKHISPAALLFSESQGRILATAAPARAREFEARMKGIDFVKIGKITSEPAIKIRGAAGKLLAHLPLKDAARAYRRTPLA